MSTVEKGAKSGGIASIQDSMPDGDASKLVGTREL
jgi:hypothetical protein